MAEPSSPGSPPGSYDLSTVDLNDDRYEVKQSAIRNKYAVRDSAGNVVLRGKQKMFKMKEEFPFVTGNGEDAFTVKAGGIMDVAGNYAITDAGTGEEVVVLDEDFSLFVENWTIRDPDTGEALATIQSKSKPLSALRHLVSVANLIPNKYEIFDASGNHVGDIEGKLSLRDAYTVSIDDASDVPKEAVIASACILDALENK
ncbi:LURP-one-related/scramblase family protein [Haloarchaeobius amylolyticus]|uniref:LURP-one-related/scramblase family protein n=1 Tax=Haloarchaeobius amylolyticus TaxID=1198296 RepID=A0ABD6BIT2_9EURY